MGYLTILGLEYSRLTVLMMIALLAIGTNLYLDFPKREDPEILIRTASVNVTFSGMPPERMEQLIANPVERKIREIPEVDEIKTLITTGSTTIDVVVKDQYSDLSPIWQELRDQMEEVARELPEGTVGPYVNSNFGDVTIASVAMTAEGFNFREMRDSAEELQRQLYLLDGVAKVELFGIQDERIWLEVDAERLASIGVQMANLITDLQEQNIILPGGTLNANGQAVLLEASGDFEAVSDISNMLTEVEGIEEFVRLGDLVTVQRGVVSPKNKPVFYNGRPAVVVTVQMQSGVDIEDLGKQIRTAVKRYENSLPIGYVLEFASFQPDNVVEAVNNAVSNVAQTFAVVLLVMMLALGIRSGLIIASIVPFAVMFALIGMSLLDVDLEQVSIAAIIISLGLLVDNGVVVVEEILRRQQLGESIRDAALAAGQQFSAPLMISSLTTIFAFMPFFMLEGGDGEYSFSLGAVVALTLIGSWLSAIYFLPFVSVFGLRLTKRQDRKKQTGFARVIPYYRSLLQRAQRVPLVTILLAYGAVVGAVMLLGVVPNQMFPLSDRSQVLIYQELPKGADVSATEASVKKVVDWIMDDAQNPEVDSHIVYIGSGGPRFYLSLDPADTAPENAFYLINTLTPEGAIAFDQRAKRYLYENHPEARFKIKRLSLGSGESGTVEVKISGPELDDLLSYASEVEEIFRGLPRISQNENDWGEKLLKVIIDVDQDKARRTGISSESMSQLLSAYFNGYQISTYQEDDQSIPIVLRASEVYRDSADDLMNMVLGSNGETVSLEQIATIKPILEYSQIRRLDQVRTITITAKSEVLTAGELLAEIQPSLDKLSLPSHYKIEIGGELADSKEINDKLLGGLPVAFLLVLLVIILQFNSFRRATVIFMTVPLVIIGVPIGLLLLSQPMSFFGTLGLISLAGIIINNAIVLIDQIDIEREKKPLQEAIIDAATKRIRPILLTSTTTVIGLVPLYLFGGSLWTPLAVVMMFGLAFASLLTTLFVPASYQLLMTFDSSTKNK